MNLRNLTEKEAGDEKISSDLFRRPNLYGSFGFWGEGTGYAGRPDTC